jgi:hypothetical protein
VIEVELYQAKIQIRDDLSWKISANNGPFEEAALDFLIVSQIRFVLSVSPDPAFDLATRLVKEFPSHCQIIAQTAPTTEEFPPGTII